MDDLEFLKSRVPKFATYEEERDRHLADKQVRAFVGETLAILRQRLEGEFSQVLSAQLERIMLRCEFSDPKFANAIQGPLTREDIDRLYGADRALFEDAIAIAADALREDHDDLVKRLADLERHFDRRASILHPWV